MTEQEELEYKFRYCDMDLNKGPLPRLVKSGVIQGRHFFIVDECMHPRVYVEAPDLTKDDLRKFSQEDPSSPLNPHQPYSRFGYRYALSFDFCGRKFPKYIKRFVPEMWNEVIGKKYVGWSYDSPQDLCYISVFNEFGPFVIDEDTELCEDLNEVVTGLRRWTIPEIYEHIRLFILALTSRLM